MGECLTVEAKEGIEEKTETESENEKKSEFDAVVDKEERCKCR